MNKFQHRRAKFLLTIGNLGLTHTSFIQSFTHIPDYQPSETIIHDAILQEVWSRDFLEIKSNILTFLDHLQTESKG